MELSAEKLALLFVIGIVVLSIVDIVYAIFSKNYRRGSSANSVSIFGATSQFQTLDQKAATEHILDVQADKKMEEEKTGEPDIKQIFLKF